MLCAGAYGISWYVNLVMLLRFVQVVIWRRVKEVNEGLLSRAVTITVTLVCVTLGWLTNPEYKVYAISSVYSGRVSELPMAACIDGIDPLHQKFVIKANICLQYVFNECLFSG